MLKRCLMSMTSLPAVSLGEIMAVLHSVNRGQQRQRNMEQKSPLHCWKSDLEEMFGNLRQTSRNINSSSKVGK